MKNRLVTIFIIALFLLGTVPVALGATSQKNKISVSITALDVGGPNTQVNDEYVAITNKGTTDVKMNGWTIRDKKTEKGIVHTYYFPASFILKAKKSVEIHTGKSNGPGTHTKHHPKLFWGKGWYVWNNEGDTAYLYNQKVLVSSLKVN